MLSSTHRSRTRSKSSRPTIEALETRDLLSSTLLVSVPGPVPASAIAGAKVNARIGVNIADQGPDRVNSSYTISLFASQDSSSSDGSEIATITRHLNIANGSNKTIFLKVPLFPQNLNGTYNILAEVSGPSTANVGISGSTVAISPVHVDLSNSVVSVPAKAHIGNKFTAVLDVSNFGNQTAVGILDTLFELSPTADAANAVQVANVTTHIRLKAGASKILRLRVPVALGAQSGNQFIVSVLDPSAAFNDSNLGNNTAVSTTPVSFL